MKLKRLNRETIERYLNPKTTTYNISAKVQKKVLKISKTIITTTDNTFNVDIKINAKEISIKQSQIAADEPISCRVLRPRTAAVTTSPSRNSKKNRKSGLTVAIPQSKPINKMIEEAWRNCKSCNSKKKVKFAPMIL